MLRSLLSSHCSASRRTSTTLTLLTSRCISSTPYLGASWMEKVKGMITGKKPAAESADFDGKFTLLGFADQMKKARVLGTLKKHMMGGSNEIEKHEALLRYLGGIDPTGEKIQASHKIEAAKNCNCSVGDVEIILAKFAWAKEAQKKIEQLKAEGKPMPKSLGEMQKLMGSSPLESIRSNLAQSGNVSRNSPCPCGSKKLYKRCCGKDKSN